MKVSSAHVRVSDMGVGMASSCGSFLLSDRSTIYKVRVCKCRQGAGVIKKPWRGYTHTKHTCSHRQRANKLSLFSAAEQTLSHTCLSNLCPTLTAETCS